MEASYTEDQGNLTSDKWCQTETLQNCSCQTTQTLQEPCGNNPGRNSAHENNIGPACHLQCTDYTWWSFLYTV